jgi:hypothetical protein
VRHLDGPLLVARGAGSGKTRVIAAKIGYLLERGFDPRESQRSRSERAAREMRERVGELLARQGGQKVASSRSRPSTRWGAHHPRRREGAWLKPGSDPRPRRHPAIVAELIPTTDRARARTRRWRSAAGRTRSSSPSSR